MEKKVNFKAEVQYRLATINRTQKELAKRLKVSEPHLSNLLKCVTQTPYADFQREKILKSLREMEKESRCLIEK